MVKPQVRMLVSDVSHMPLHLVWRDSGVTHRHGFELSLDVCVMQIDGQPWIDMNERAPKLLEGTYDFLSGLHHETYSYRGRGDKRFVYLAQAQNDWDNRVVTIQQVTSANDLEGKRFLVTSIDSPCVFGNLKHSLQLAGAAVDRIDFVEMRSARADSYPRAVQAVVDGEAAATSVNIPFDLRGEKLGLRRLDIPSLPVIYGATICSNREWVVENAETVLAFLRSMVDAIHFFKTQPSRVSEILERGYAPLLGLEGRDEIEYLRTSVAARLSPKPFPHPLAVWNLYNLDVAHDPKANFIGPLEIWDTSFLRTIDDSGYIDELYGGPEAAANPPVNAVI